MKVYPNVKYNRFRSVLLKKLLKTLLVYDKEDCADKNRV